MSAGSLLDVEFYYLTDKHILAKSAVQVESHSQYIEYDPVPGGIYDPHMGVISTSGTCWTCGLRKGGCQGHIGHIKLTIPVPDPSMRSEIQKWLKVICYYCGRLLAEPALIEALPRTKRLLAASKLSSSEKACPACHMRQPKIAPNKADSATLITIGADEKPTVIRPEYLLELFERVPMEVVTLMRRPAGMHPKNLIRRVFPIAPVSIRPGTKPMGVKSYATSGSSNLIQYIIKRNNSIGSVDKKSEDIQRQALYQLIYSYINGKATSQITKIKEIRRELTANGKPIPGLLRVLNSKQGRLRRDLLGKTTLNIGRATISGNVERKLEEVEVPREVAMSMCVAETVQEYNRDRLMTYVLNGPNVYPGCSRVAKKHDKGVYDVGLNRGITLEIGDVVYRHLITGDFGFMNRQPTMARSDISLIVAVVATKLGTGCLKFDVITCRFFGACDFDGDENNIWIPKHPASIAEAMVNGSLMGNFIHPGSSSPIPGQTQDSIVGLFELTRSTVRLDKNHVVQLLGRAGVDFPLLEEKASGYTGRDVITLILRNYPISYYKVPTFVNPIYNKCVTIAPEDTKVVIDNGVHVSGVLDKASISDKTADTIYHQIASVYDNARAFEAIHQMQLVGIGFNQMNGFTVGVGDMVVSKDVRDGINRLTAEVLAKAELINQRLLSGNIVAQIGTTVGETYENMMLNALQVNDTDLMGQILPNLNLDDNGMFKIIATGSKGSLSYLKNIIGTIGQVTINDNRFEENYGFRRTSPYFQRFSTEPAASGYVKSAYFTGLNTREYIWDAANSRNDLSSRALVTPVSGNYMRLNTMSMQGEIVDYRRRIVSGARIVAQLYGDDGVDPQKMERVSMPLIGVSRTELIQKTCGELKGPVIDDYLALVTSEIKWLLDFRIRESTFIKINEHDVRSILLPVNIRRILISYLTEQKRATSGDPRKLAQDWANVKDFAASLVYAHGNSTRAARGDRMMDYERASTRLLALTLFTEFTPQRMLLLHDDDFNVLFARIKLKYYTSMISYGTMVGIMAVQSLIAPLTQNMLDSHKSLGGKGQRRTGLRRLDEMFSARPPSKEDSASMTIWMRSPDGAPMTGQQLVSATKSIEQTTLRELVTKSTVLYESLVKLTYPGYQADSKWMAEWHRGNSMIRVPSDVSNWCLRFELNKLEMIIRAVPFVQIVTQLAAAYPSAYLMYSSETLDNPVIRLYLTSGYLNKVTQTTDMRAVLAAALDTVVRGLDGVLIANVVKQPYLSIGADDALESKSREVTKTVGSNLYSVLFSGPVAVDRETISTTSIGETLMFFGIEACRQTIIHEITGIIKNTNMRHVIAYADTMTSTGSVTPMLANGAKIREAHDRLLRIAVADPLRTVLDSVCENVRAPVGGPIPSLLMGTVARVGSLYSEFAVNEKFVAENIESLQKFIEEI